MALWLLASPAAADVDAAKVFEDKCMACHGKTGTPPKAFAKLGVRDLSDSEWHASRTDEQIRDSIAKGAEDTLMRAFDKELHSDEIAALVRFVRSLKTEASSRREEN
jgi:mono/diheme cytochrome c family protein